MGKLSSELWSLSLESRGYKKECNLRDVLYAKQGKNKKEKET